ncbi:conserved hypothetical protein [Heliomicrobium modesticaldum Ice1]|uniref:Cupin type-2 domain-containing protein n=1 Tax=Heliobacterium modesticaldum (strain ATCC 51547 / Ice1) TaxID=498761 RepID=B0THQ6_HELMI|nr:cupin domain-containing protein [Heliomicrobium modesticaldum]ABZ84839.1 conserved hypothetical protein [Heliomicrobium modesticaldum Ice1]
MFVSDVASIPVIQLEGPGIIKAAKQSLIGPAQGWDGWSMRLFTLSEGGQTPRHSHPWPHINYVVGGRGTLFLGGKEHPIQAGSIAYIPGGEEHQFMNVSGEDFSFICIVPAEADK